MGVRVCNPVTIVEELNDRYLSAVSFHLYLMLLAHHDPVTSFWLDGKSDERRYRDREIRGWSIKAFQRLHIFLSMQPERTSRDQHMDRGRRLRGSCPIVLAGVWRNVHYRSGVFEYPVLGPCFLSSEDLLSSILYPLSLLSVVVDTFSSSSLISSFNNKLGGLQVSSPDGTCRKEVR